MPRLVLAFVVAAALAGAAASPALAQDAPQTAEEAQQRVDDPRAAANDAAARLSDATTKYEEIGNEISRVAESIERGRQRVADLKEIVRTRAVEAYTGEGAGTDELSVLFSSDDLLEALKRVNLIDAVNAKDDNAIDQLTELERELQAHKDELDRRKAEQADALRALEQEQQEVQAKVAAAEEAQRVLLERFAREAAEEAARRAAEAAAAAARSSVSGPVVVNPGGGPFICPVQGGAAFTDDFGAPRTGHTHGGTDMFASEGTPVVAVAAGEVAHGSSGAGGTEAYLTANGNGYLYAHLSAYEGEPRSVQQGEVLGYVGHTGNAQGDHLHFEIRVGGMNGTKVNPFATLRQYC